MNSASPQEGDADNPPASSPADGLSCGIGRIIFWQPIVSPHQTAFLECLAGAFAGEVVLAAERDLPAERVLQGWNRPRHQRVTVIDASDPVAFAAQVAHSGADSLHLFSGFFSHPIVWRAFRQLAASRAHLAMISEAPELPRATGWLKRCRGRWLAARWSRRLAFVLAMGDVGRDFFRAVGFPAEAIETFGYALAVPAEPRWPEPDADDTTVRFIAAGQLIRRKGFDLLFEALASLPPVGWRLDLYGTGPERPALRRRIDREAMGERIFLHPTVGNEELQQRIAESDWSVVPSRHDGWGMIVNESLIAGTPTVCTAACGAAVIIDSPAAGLVVPAADAAALADALGHCLSGGRIGTSRRRQVREVAWRQSPERAVEAFLRRMARLGSMPALKSTRQKEDGDYRR